MRPISQKFWQSRVSNDHSTGTFCAGLGTAAAISAYFGISVPTLLAQRQKLDKEKEGAHYVNWSNTHEAHPKYNFQPETEDDLQRIVSKAHKTGKPSRLSIEKTSHPS